MHRRATASPGKRYLTGMTKPKRYLTGSDIAPYRKANTPRRCPILGLQKYRPVLDHDHENGMVRGVISNGANVLLGKFEKGMKRYAPECRLELAVVLDNMAKYLRRPNSLILHPIGCTQLCKRFKGYKVQKQNRMLRALGADRKMITSCRNPSQRAKMYRSLLTKSL